MVSKQQDGGMRVVGLFATMAQLVAQIICTDKVVGSIPACGSSLTDKKIALWKKKKTLEQTLREQVIEQFEEQVSGMFTDEVPKWRTLEQLKRDVEMLERYKSIFVNGYDKQIAAYKNRIKELEDARSETESMREQMRKSYQEFRELHPELKDIDL